MNAILAEIKHSKYFSISVDSTPDISHSDQLAFCVRYAKSGMPIERFIQFIHINQHNSEYLSNTVINFLSKHSINFSDCRGQSYDNANNMAGKYSGLQQRLLQLNKYAIFIPCAAHSLNLVGTAAVSDNRHAASFFCFTESIYTFFVDSTFRWDLLTNALASKQKTLKRSSGTRWYAKFNSIDALNGSIKQVKDVLLQMINDEQLQTNGINKVLATGHIRNLCKFENILMLKIWYAILKQFERVSKILQKSDLNVSIAVRLYRGLISYCEGVKDKFQVFFDDAKSVYIELDSEQHISKSRSAMHLH